MLTGARHRLAALQGSFAEAAAPELARTVSDTLASELLPLLEASKFLERSAAALLKPRKLGRRGLPFWLSGIRSEILRVPFGTVLVIGPSNYPLFLPGVQTLQALAAGNAVIWKPGHGGVRTAEIFASAMGEAGLPEGLLRITEESVEAAQREIQQGVDKVFFTGSASSGRALLRQLAATLTPCVAELSGCDAVVVLPSADLTRVVKALAFGMRLNGSATCMAPRRVLLVDADERRRDRFTVALQSALEGVRGVPLPDTVRLRLVELLRGAQAAGATVVGGDASAPEVRPLLVLNGQTAMEIANADIFAPVLTLVSVTGESGVLAAHEACSYALTTSIFGNEEQARAIATRLTVGTVLINDLIVPTADPRLPFGGRRRSGFGTTRGIDGLLEMTAVKVVAVRRGTSERHYDAPTPMHDRLIGGVVTAAHGSSVRGRWLGVKQLVDAGRRLNQR